jgi:hypothetical protein
LVCLPFRSDFAWLANLPTPFIYRLSFFIAPLQCVRVCNFFPDIETGQHLGQNGFVALEYLHQSYHVAEGNHTHTFASLTSKPTALAGYGITNAALDNNVIHRNRVCIWNKTGELMVMMGLIFWSDAWAQVGYNYRPSQTTKSIIGIRVNECLSWIQVTFISLLGQRWDQTCI